MFDYNTARQHMVDNQIRPSDVTNHDVLKAFRNTAREMFVPSAQKSLAYGDAHIDMDEGRTLIRPRDFSKMVQAANIAATDVVLDIACGRGYSTAILAQLAETVVGLEDDETRVERATANLLAADITNAAIVQGALKGGAPEHGPFNVIFVNGSVPEAPKSWLDQLAHEGRLVVVIQDGPVGRGCVYTRSGDTVGEHVVFDASLPPLSELKREPAFVF